MVDWIASDQPPDAQPRRTTGIPLATKTGIPNYVSPEEYAASRTGTGYIQASRDYVFGKGKGRDVDPGAGRYYVDPKQAAADRVAPAVTGDGKPYTPPASMSVEKPTAPRAGAPAAYRPASDLPTEAGILIPTIRGAEGTARGDGYVYFGGEPFKPGKDHPGEAARRIAPNGDVTHAAGPGQWLKTTWDGLKPDFEKRYGHEPDFSSNEDQDRAIWLKAAQRYGGEDKLRADLAAGKLDKSKLSEEWTGLRGGGGGGGSSIWGVARTDKPGGRFSDEGVAFTQDRPRTRMFWIDPNDYINDREEQSDKETRPKRRSLAKSLALGDDIEVPPEFQGEIKGGKLVLTGGDGAQRARAFAEGGGTLMPVAVTGIPKEGDLPKEYVNLRGETKPLDWTPMPPVQRATLIENEKARPLGTMGAIGAGIRDVGMGAMQNLARLPGPAISNLFLTPEQKEQLTPEGLTPQQRQQYENLTRTDITQATDKAAAEREAVIEARRQAAGQDKGDTDWARLGGNVLGTMPLAAVGPGGNLGAVGNMLRAGGQGVAGAMMAPVTEGDFGAERLQGGALGLLTGAGVGALGRGAAALAQPYIAPAAQRLMDLGIRLTPGMMRGGGARGLENRLSHVVPTMTGATRRAVQDFNIAAYNRVLERIGLQYEGRVVGYDGINAVEQSLASAYNRLLPNIHFRVDREFAADLQNLRTMASYMPQDDARRFAAILNNEFAQRLGPQGQMDGQTLKLVESELSRLSREFSRSQSMGDRQLGNAVGEINAAIRANLERQNPEQAAQLRRINGAWAAFVRIRDAAANRATSLGIFTPGDLLTSVRRNAGRRVFARGDGLLQDLARDAQEVIPNTYPDSGTAGRLAAGALLGGGAHMLHPGGLAAVVGANLAYTQPGVAFLRGMAGTGMPALRNMLARGGRAVGNALAAPAGYGGAQLPQQ